MYTYKLLAICTISFYCFIFILIFFPISSESYNSYFIYKDIQISPCIFEEFSKSNVNVNHIYNYGSKALLFVQGWSNPEKGFRWTDGNIAKILFNIDFRDIDHAKCLELLLSTFGRQQIQIVLNGSIIFESILNMDTPTLCSIQLKSGDLRDGVNSLTFYLPDCKKDAPGDPRALALQFRQLAIKKTII